MTMVSPVAPAICCNSPLPIHGRDCGIVRSWESGSLATSSSKRGDPRGRPSQHPTEHGTRSSAGFCEKELWSETPAAGQQGRRFRTIPPRPERRSQRQVQQSVSGRPRAKAESEQPLQTPDTALHRSPCMLHRGPATMTLAGSPSAWPDSLRVSTNSEESVAAAVDTALREGVVCGT